MTQTGTGWPRGRTYWVLGSLLLLGLGILFGLVWQNVWLGLITRRRCRWAGSSPTSRAEAETSV